MALSKAGAKLPRPRLWRRSLGAAIAALLACSMWFYVERILVPYQRREAAQHGRPRGNLSDLYPRWLGARELLLHHRDPYSPEITREIQEGYYGRALDQRRPYDPKDQQRFAYPLYVALLLAPSIRLDFAVVQRVFTWVLVALTGLSVWWWLKALHWQVSRGATVILVLLTLGSFPAVQGIKLQQLSLLVGALMAMAIAALAAGWLALAGVLLGLASIKPQVSVPLAAWIVLWSFGHLRRRWPAPAGLIGSVVSLIGGGEVLLPGWIEKFRIGLSAYRQYTGGISLLTFLLGAPGGWMATAVLVGLLAVYCWRMRRIPAASGEFAWTMATVLAVTIVIIPTFAPYNQVLLLPAILLLSRDWRLVARQGVGVRLLYLVGATLLLWPWIAALSLMIGSLFVSAARVQDAWTVPLYTSVPIPLAVTGLMMVEIWRFDGSKARSRTIAVESWRA